MNSNSIRGTILSNLSMHRLSAATLSSACAAVLLAACGGGSSDTTVADASSNTGSSTMLAETTVSSTWTRCATEYGTCSFSGTRQVRFGLGDKWATRTATGSIE